MRFGAIVFVLGALACGAESAPAAVKRRALPPGIAASVGTELVEVGTVARIASARSVSASQARELAIRDALFSAAARVSSEHAMAVVVAERSNLGRALLELFARQAESQGPPSDAEVNELTAERWTEFARPQSVRTTHAVVIVEKPEQDAASRALAEKLAGELRGITSSGDFVARAQAFPAAPLRVVAERLGPVTPDGRMWEWNARPGTKFPTLDAAYTKAATALERPGDQSPLVKSSFGYHVILLEERIPALEPSLEERRALLRAEIVSRRAKKLSEDALARLHQGTPVEVVRAADSLTELVLGTP
jgi:hypothetical protein